MAAILPTQVFANYQLLAATDPAPSQGIFIPMASLSGLSVAEANAATGNGSELLRIILDVANSNVNALAPEAKPTMMSIAKGTATKVGANDRQPYTVTFTLTATGFEMASEPN